LGIPCVSNVEALENTSSGLQLRRRLEDSVEILEATGPLVVSVCEYSYPLRLPGIMAMRRAKTKQVERISAADVGLTAQQCGLKGSLTKVIAMEAKFPGLRKGPKETDLATAAATAADFCREVGL
jgi:electron transfer flavoprotein beta subunit